MKLLDKTNLYFLQVALLVFTCGGILFYFLFQMIIDRDFNNRLRERSQYYTETLVHSDSLLYFQHYSANSIGVIPVANFSDSTEVLSDTTIFDRIEGKDIRYRQIAVNRHVRNRKYRISVRRALVERKSVIQGVVLLEGFLFLAFVAILVALNNQLSRRIWRPFYGILDTINSYKIDHAENLKFNRQSITEFNELASAIERMTAKIHREYDVMKEFSENASHEIQTPLAIITNKLEVLMQSPSLSDSQLNMISAASQAATRLSKLNEALIILSRIENRQFHAVENISFNVMTEERLAGFDELIRMKNISVTKTYQSELIVKISPFLADMMLDNLIVNAIKHNVEGGSMVITIEERKFTISNAGDAPDGEPSRFFERFHKSNPKSNSLGLGLSIVKGVAETYRLPIRYTFSGNIHTISIEFPV